MVFGDVTVYEVWVNEYACRLAARGCGTVYMEAIGDDSTTRYVYAADGRRVVSVSHV